MVTRVQPRPNTDTQAWREQAACRGMDTELFYSSHSTPLTVVNATVAKTCRICPVRRECLEDAMEVEAGVKQYRHGIRGGLTAHARQSLYEARRKRARRKADWGLDRR